MKKMDNKGFSLVELIVVIAIMAVLIGVLAPTLLGNIEKSKLGTDKEAINQLYKAVEIASAEGGITVNESGKIVYTTDTKTLTFEMVGDDSTAVDSGDQDAFNKAVKEYIGADDTDFKSKYYQDGITVTFTFNAYGKPIAQITDGDDSFDTAGEEGDFYINE